MPPTDGCRDLSEFLFSALWQVMLCVMAAVPRREDGNVSQVWGIFVIYREQYLRFGPFYYVLFGAIFNFSASASDRCSLSYYFVISVSVMIWAISVMLNILYVNVNFVSVIGSRFESLAFRRVWLDDWMRKTICLLAFVLLRVTLTRMNCRCAVSLSRARIIGVIITIISIIYWFIGVSTVRACRIVSYYYGTSIIIYWCTSIFSISFYFIIIIRWVIRLNF